MANFPVTPEPVTRGEAITEGDDALQILADQDVTDAGDATVGSELTKLALFLTTPAARHITGQTVHVGRGALANFG